MTALAASPLVYLVTDRRRLAPGRSDAEACDQVVAQVRAWAAEGVDVVQVRERDLGDRALATLVQRCVEAVDGTPCAVLVNDRADVALACGAHGVHLRNDSLPAPRVREIAPSPFIVGRSVHGAAEAASVVAEGGVDYLIFGPVFPTASKPEGIAPAGTDGLRAVSRVAAPVPVLAIGGVTADNGRAVMSAGAGGAAGIGPFATTDPAGVRARLARLRESLTAQPYCTENTAR